MSDCKAVLEQPIRGCADRPASKKAGAHRTGWSSTVAAVAMLAIMGCGDLHLSTSNLQIAPNPAGPGDMVVASFVLSLVPLQQYTIVVLIDDTEYLRVTMNEQPAVPVVIQLGDADALIARYGTGAHFARVEVRAEEDNEITQTAPTSFELEETSS